MVNVKQLNLIYQTNVYLVNNFFFICLLINSSMTVFHVQFYKGGLLKSIVILQNNLFMESIVKKCNQSKHISCYFLLISGQAYM